MNFVEVTDDDKVFVGYCTAVGTIILALYHRMSFLISGPIAQSHSHESGPVDCIRGT